jgi:polyisoprenoid-binding protein YceI
MKHFTMYIATLSILWMAFAFLPQEKLGWKIDKKYSVRFSSPSVGGEFNIFKGIVVFDKNDLKSASFKLTIDPASVNTGNAMQNGHIQQKDWLDAKNYPSIDFVSTSFEEEDNNYYVVGDLTLHGVKRKIKIPFTFLESKKTAKLDAKFSINRFDYGVGNPNDGVDSVLNIDVLMPLKR